MRQTSPISSNSHNTTSWFARLHYGHERLKQSVHQGMRVPLPKWGQRVMGAIYFCIPIIGGYYVMQWAIGRSHASIGPNGEWLPKKETETKDDDRHQRQQQLPTYGVPLASSDPETQRKNKEKLQRFLRQQFKPQQNNRQKQQEETDATA